MKRWLAGRLRDFVTRQMEPFTAQILDRVDAAARESREHYDIGVARVEALLLASNRREDDTRRRSAEAKVREFGAVVRMHGATQASVADVRAALRNMDPVREAGAQDTGPMRAAGARHVIFLGAGPAPEDADALEFLKHLRFGLDRLEDDADGREVWIERTRSLMEPDPVLTHDSYNRVLKNGTQSIEVLRSVDALAIRQALDRNGRSDVRLVYRWLGTELPDSEHQALPQALACADDWVFPGPEIWSAVRAAYSSAMADDLDRHVHVHPLPASMSMNAVALARAYRNSVEQILALPQR